MANFKEIVKDHVDADGNIPATAIDALTKAITSAVGNEFVDKARYKAKLEEIDTLRGEKETAEDNATTAEKWKDKYDALKSEFGEYKAGVAAKETKAAKEAAAKSYFEGKNITGKALAIALRAAGKEIDGVKLGDDGKIKDTAALDGLIAGDFSGLVSKQSTSGARTSNPPGNESGSRSPSRAAQLAARYYQNLYGTNPNSAGKGEQ